MPQPSVRDLFDSGLPGGPAAPGKEIDTSERMRRRSPPPATPSPFPTPERGDSPGGAGLPPEGQVIRVSPKGGQVVGEGLPSQEMTYEGAQERNIGRRQKRRRIRANIIVNFGAGDIPSLTKDNFDPYGYLGVDWFEGRTRIDMKYSKNFSEMEAKFKDAFPDGDIKQIPLGRLLSPAGPVGGVRAAVHGPPLIFRRDKKDKWKELDPPMGDAGEVADVFAALTHPLLIGGIAGSATGKKFYTLVGALFGGTAGITIEELRGYQHAPLPEAFKHMSREAIFFQLMNSGLVGVLKLADGLRASKGRIGEGIAGAFITPTESAEYLVKEAIARGIDPLVAGQLARHPMYRAMYAQAGSLSPLPGEHIAAVMASTRKHIKDMIRLNDDGLMGLSDANLGKLSEHLYRQVDKIIMNPKITSRNVQGALQKSMDQFNKVLGIKIDKGYEALLSSKRGQDLTFDISGVKKVGADIRQGVWTRKDTGESMQIGPAPSTDGVKLLDDIEAMSEVLTRRVAGPKGGQRKTFTAWKQLDAIRTRAADLMHSAKEADQIVGSRIWGAVSEILKNPKGLSEAGQAFAKEYMALGLSVKFKSTVNQMAWVKTGLHDMKPTDFFNKFLGPNNYTEVLMAKRIMPPEQFAKLRDGLLTRLFANSEGIAKALDAYRLPESQAMLRMILGEEDLALVKMAGAFERRTSGGIVNQQLGNDLTNAQRAMEMLKTNPAGLQALIDMSHASHFSVKGVGYGSVNKLLESMRYGVYQDLLNKATRLHPRLLGPDKTPLEVLDAGILKSEITKLRAMENIKLLFSPKEMEGLKFFETMADSIIKSSDDVGGLMQRGGTAAAAKKPNPSGWVRVITTVGGNAMFARIAGNRANWHKIGKQAESMDTTKRLLMMGIGTYNNILKQELSPVLTDENGKVGASMPKAEPAPEDDLINWPKLARYARNTWSYIKGVF